MSKEANARWQDIVGSKVPGFFGPGSLPLLRSYIELNIIQEQLLARRRETGDDDDAARLERRIGALATVLCTLATKLRLSVQAEVERHSRKISQRPVPSHPLLGGNIQRLPA